MSVISNLHAIFLSGTISKGLRMKININDIEAFKIRETGVIYKEWTMLPSETPILDILAKLREEDFFRPVYGIIAVTPDILLRL